LGASRKGKEIVDRFIYKESCERERKKLEFYLPLLGKARHESRSFAELTGAADDVSWKP
jgi:hypothetical protein